MNTIHILSESAAIGMRLRDILYQAGFTDITVSDLKQSAGKAQTGLLIIYAKSHISELMQHSTDRRGSVILLLNPDSYAMYRDRAGAAGITLLLMPVAPFVLLDAVQEAIAIS
ncbi:MAG: hypothetical protein IJ060_10360 [Oscillospiraceae bacterium]|nr:hypothetical protein [Oscillospiraceae bacterium]